MKNYISSAYGVSLNESLGPDLKEAFTRKKNVYANFLGLYPITRCIINFYDPIGFDPGVLIPSAPLNEYDLEINEILDGMNLDLPSLTLHIEKVLKKWFGDEKENYSISEPEFYEMCYYIHKNLNNEYYKTPSRKHVIESLVINADFLELNVFDVAQEIYSPWVSKIEKQKLSFEMLADLIKQEDPILKVRKCDLIYFVNSLNEEIENAVFLQSQYDKLFLNK